MSGFKNNPYSPCEMEIFDKYASGDGEKIADITEAQARVRASDWPDPECLSSPLHDEDSQQLSLGVVGGDEQKKQIKLQNEPDWLHKAAKYEWDDDYGDVGPEVPELEKQLYHADHLMSRGNDIEALEFEVKIEGPSPIRPVRRFADAGLHPIMLKNVELCRYDSPTPIQAWALPIILSGYDVLASAQTGSGKTAAYFVPVLSRLMGKASNLCAPRKPGGTRGEPLVMVVCPTRELAIQIFDEARRLCYRSMLRPCVVYGGAPSAQQRDDVRKGCDVLIATVGRLGDFLRQKVIALSRLQYTILDEADEMLQPSWEDDLKMILSSIDPNEGVEHMFMMFSATFSRSVLRVSDEFLSREHFKISVGRIGSTHTNIKQEFFWVEEDLKLKALFDLLLTLPPARTLVFVNTKLSVDEVDKFLFNLKLPSTSIHAGRSQREREDAIRAFRSGKCPILVTTGVTARGLDIKNVMHVINCDLPRINYGSIDGIDDYIHRIGRTARIGNPGLATSFYNDRDSKLAPALVKVLMETNQPVPDFMQEYIPADGIVTWSDEDEGEITEDRTWWGKGKGKGKEKKDLTDVNNSDTDESATAGKSEAGGDDQEDEASSRMKIRENDSWNPDEVAQSTQDVAWW